jgi:hypothetical protein
MGKVAGREAPSSAVPKEHCDFGGGKPQEAIGGANGTPGCFGVTDRQDPYGEKWTALANVQKKGGVRQLWVTLIRGEGPPSP